MSNFIEAMRKSLDAEIKRIEDEAFQRGVERGRLDLRTELNSEKDEAFQRGVVSGRAERDAVYAKTEDEMRRINHRRDAIVVQWLREQVNIAQGVYDLRTWLDNTADAIERRISNSEQPFDAYIKESMINGRITPSLAEEVNEKLHEMRAKIEAGAEATELLNCLDQQSGPVVLLGEFSPTAGKQVWQWRELFRKNGPRCDSVRAALRWLKENG